MASWLRLDWLGRGLHQRALQPDRCKSEGREELTARDAPESGRIILILGFVKFDPQQTSKLRNAHPTFQSSLRHFGQAHSFVETYAFGKIIRIVDSGIGAVATDRKAGIEDKAGCGSGASFL